MSAILTMRSYYDQPKLEEEIKKHMEDGWLVMYVVPFWQPPINHNQFSNSTSQYVTIAADGTQTFHIPIISSPSSTPPIFEVCFYKRDYQSDPCPRCSYPFPDEDNIGREP